MATHEEPPEEQAPSEMQALPDAVRCLHCPILQYCMVEIEALQELPQSAETEAIISSYVRFFSGVNADCWADGPAIETKRRFLIAGPEIIEITCKSQSAKHYSDIRTSRHLNDNPAT